MTEYDVLAVGAPPTFRDQVARALEREPGDVEWMPSVTAVESFIGDQPGATSVIVLSPVVRDADAFGLAAFVARMSPATAIVLVRDRAMNGLLPAAMRAGIRDVVDLSLGSQELREAVQRAMEWSSNIMSVRGGPTGSEDGHRGSVIAVFSSKGGTGKTFLACNLALALADRSGLDTALVDFDFEMGDVLSYFGRESKLALEDVIGLGSMPDREAALNTGIQVADHVWTFAGRTEPGIAATVSGEAAGRLIQTLRSLFPLTVVDAAASYSDQALATFDVADAICLITGLDIVGVRHLAKALDTLVRLDIPRERFRVILNRADSKVGLEVAEVERVMKLKVDAMIPSSRLVPTSLNWGRPIYADAPKSEVAKSIGLLADKLASLAAVPAGETSDAPARKRWLSRR